MSNTYNYDDTNIDDLGHIIDPNKPILCWRCRNHGHAMKIYLKPYLDEDGHIKQKPYNYYSQTKHNCMVMSEGNDF